MTPEALWAVASVLYRRVSERIEPEQHSFPPTRTLSKQAAVGHYQSLCYNLQQEDRASLGYRAHAIVNGSELQPHGAITMDVQMPKVDGFQGSKARCAREPAAERPPFVATVVSAMQGDCERCLHGGVGD